MSQINIGFSLHDRHGKVMSIIYSAPKHYYSLKRGINHFKVTITDINFTPGTYLIKTRFEQLGNGIYWPNDYIADFYIPVNSNDQHSRQEILINGQVLLEASWCNG
ncbi:MAG: hypothetical protein HOC16_00380 [Candidatus Pacebacteria bacterium]|nr:hypothetical protein [Candidatus Paceibacterota bacterium]